MTPRPRPFRCAAAARQRADPQLGSAPQARSWLLIEHFGPWQVDAFAGSGVSAEIRALLGRAAQAAGARPLLIRRPGRVRRHVVRVWAVTSEAGGTIWGQWRSDEDLNAAADALRSPPESEVPAADPIILVCTHGLHDACCAIRGRPVAAALHREWPTETWECSHVGGDRFAANVVLLPDGVYYGNLDADNAVETVRAHLRGEVVVANLRGMTRVAPPAQAAIAAVHERFGPFGPCDVEVTSIEHPSTGLWVIRLDVPVAGLVGLRATVASTRRATAQLTCRALAETPATTYRTVDLQDPR